jgi:hypothetical protein
MTRWHQLADIAGAQHGVVARRQAEALGIPASTLSDQFVVYGWRRVHPGVFALPGAPATFRLRVSAALLAAGSAAIACRRTAAHLLGCWPQPDIVELFVPLQQRARSLNGVRCARTGSLRPSDRSEIAGLRITTAPRTLIDLAAVLEPPALRAVLIDSRQRRLLTYERVLAALDGLGPLRGKGVVRRLLWELDAERCDSVLEAIVRALLRRAGIPDPNAGPFAVRAGARTLHLDIAWPEQRVGIEVDGFAYHSSRAQFDRDGRRQNLMVLAGWRVLRVSWDRVEQDPEGFVREVRQLLAES